MKGSKIIAYFCMLNIFDDLYCIRSEALTIEARRSEHDSQVNLIKEREELYNVKQERSLLKQLANSGLTLVGPKAHSVRLENNVVDQVKHKSASLRCNALIEPLYRRLYGWQLQGLAQRESKLQKVRQYPA
jgi:porphobilinogen deaminase